MSDKYLGLLSQADGELRAETALHESAWQNKAMLDAAAIEALKLP